LWEPTAPLAVNRWGLSEPLATAISVEPTVLLVPLLAFDRRGNRLGYGAGYYDRTLNNLRSCNDILTVGLSYSAQEVDNVPTGLTDARLDAVLTEKSLFRFSPLSSMP
ncbi:MAG: 5-formyltetrahydrofolate cyclo-ligase, partial [Alphaproteobacteria bacterium]|nr:5-formyltetrahydrofolate cyclo-ligase [Alphaproteobacteria bacterium]